MKFLRRLLCSVYLHNWDKTADTRQCTRCAKKQKLVYPYPHDAECSEWIQYDNEYFEKEDNARRIRI